MKNDLLKFLSNKELETIHNGSLSILEKIGVQVPDVSILQSLTDSGAVVDFSKQTVKIPEKLVMDSLEKAGKQFILYGRDRKKRIRFGYKDFNLPSSAGQFAWVESNGKRRDATIPDMQDAIIVGDTLEHINLVGGMALPCEIPASVRDVYMIAELVKRTLKPVHVFIANSKTFDYILKIFEFISGGKSEHQEYPMVAGFVEPISPLRFDKTGLGLLKRCVEEGLPVYFGPMAQAGATAPVTLAGTIALENAEILAAIVISQVLQPGIPVGYGGSCHTMDMRTAMISFGAPEQAILAVVMAQLPGFYGLPSLFNAGLTDSKKVDSQAGIEKATTMLIGALAGLETFAHMGICGADQGASLEQLVIDDAIAGYVKRILKGFDITEETIAIDVIKRVGIGGNFLTDEHTLNHFRDELWTLDGFNRQNWQDWVKGDSKSMFEWAIEQKEKILSSHKPLTIDPALAREIDKIVKVAHDDLVEKKE